MSTTIYVYQKVNKCLAITIAIIQVRSWYEAGSLMIPSAPFAQHHLIHLRILSTCSGAKMLQQISKCKTNLLLRRSNKKTFCPLLAMLRYHRKRGWRARALHSKSAILIRDVSNLFSFCFFFFWLVQDRSILLSAPPKQDNW